MVTFCARKIALKQWQRWPKVSVAIFDNSWLRFCTIICIWQASLIQENVEMLFWELVPTNLVKRTSHTSDLEYKNGLETKCKRKFNVTSWSEPAVCGSAAENFV